MTATAKATPATLLLAATGPERWGVETRFGILWGSTVRDLERRFRFVFGRAPQWSGRRLVEVSP